MAQAYKAIFRNVNWILIEKVSKAILTAVTSVIVAKYLGASGLGLISLVLTYYTIFTAVSTLGLDRIIMRELQDPTNKKERVVGALVSLRFFGAVTAFVCFNLLIFILYSDQKAIVVMGITVSTCFFISIGTLFEPFYRIALKSKKVTIVRVFALFSSAATKLILVLVGADVTWFVVPAVIESVIITASFLALRRIDTTLALGDLEYSYSETKKLLRFAWPLLFSSLAGTLYFQLDKILIHEFLNEAELGRYALIFQLSSIFIFVLSSVDLSVMPVLNNQYFKNIDKYWVKFREVVSFKFLLSVFIAFSFALTGKFIVPWLVGEEFTYQTSLLMAFSAYLIMVSLGSMISENAILEGMMKPLLFIRVVTLLVNLLLNILLIPLMGLTGAAITSAFSYFLSQFVLTLAFPKLRPAVYQSLLSASAIYRRKFYTDAFVLLKDIMQKVR